MISYYELLGMIKEDKAPNKIKVHLTNTPRVYKADYDGSDFSHYFIYDGETDENYHYYLAECFLESDMFDLNIEIIEEEKKIPEKLDYCKENTFMIKCKENSYLTREEISLLDSNFNEIGNKINEILDYLKAKENKYD